MRTEALNAQDMKLVHDTALEILESVGLQVPSPLLLARLKEKGFRILDWNRVSLSRAAVEAALARAPRSVRLGGRGPGRSVRLDGTRTFAATDGCGSKTIDFETGARRPSALRDVAASARLTEALEEHDVYWTMVSAQDVPPSERVAREYLTALQNTTKHVQVVDVARPSEAETLARMARVLSESGTVEEAPVSMVISVVSPLRLDPSGTEAALVFARSGLPVVACSMPIAGVTAPATSAGMVMLGHAEVMGFITVLEALCPGAPVIYCLFPVFAHARTGETNYSDPRNAWSGAAAAQLGRSLGLPCFTSGGLPALMVGPDLISGGGLLETSTLLAYEQLVIDNEALRDLRMAARLQEVSSRTLAADVIRRVGPGGHFLAQKHTLIHMREFLVPKFTGGDSADEPAAVDRRAGPARERARREARRILDEHRVDPLPAKIEARLEQLIRECPAALAS